MGEGAERAAVRGLSGWVEVSREDVRPVGRVRKEKEEDDLWDPCVSGWGGEKLKECCDLESGNEESVGGSLLKCSIICLESRIESQIERLKNGYFLENAQMKNHSI